jgi:sulfate transport system permease protein
MLLPGRSTQRVLPGFGLSLGLTLFYWGLIVFLPVVALVVRAAGIPWAEFARTMADQRVLAALGLSFGGAELAAGLDSVFGFLVAWVLVRYRFPGRRLLDALIDLPFALPTAVSGIALTSLYASSGWVGRWLAPLGIQLAYTRVGVVMALMFIGLPFVVRTLQPALEELDPELEEAAACLGAGRWATWRRVILPTLRPALLTGFTLAFARAVGEYGTIVFISGNLPMKTEIAPFLIVVKLEQYDYAGAAAIALIMLAVALMVLMLIHRLQTSYGFLRG